MDEQIADLQRRHAHQEELIRQLDEALREQGRRLDGLCGKVEMLGKQRSAIINGTVDLGHPAVGYLSSSQGGSQYGCTATLIDAEVILTAMRDCGRPSRPPRRRICPRRT